MLCKKKLSCYQKGFDGLGDLLKRLGGKMIETILK